MEPSRRSGSAATDPRLDSWRSFLRAHARVTHRLDEELRAEHGLSLAEYEALLHIAQSAGRRLRMSQLADRVVLSRSGVTRLIDRLVADGFVERGTCLEDARGAEAILTSSGLQRLRSASQTHLRGIEQYFLSAVTPDDLDVIGRALDGVAERATLGPRPPLACAVDDAAVDGAADGPVDAVVAGAVPSVR